VPGFDQLVSASQRPDVPRDERIDLNAEVLNQFIKGLEFPDREEVDSYLPILSKASTLEPFFEQYVVGNRRTPTHTAILYLNEYGVVAHLSGLDRSAVPRGILNVFGEYDKPQLHTFTRNLMAMVSGAGNRFNFPVMVSKSKEGGALWTKIDDFNEMLFARMLTAMVSIACSFYGAHPEELNFDSFSTRTSTRGAKRTPRRS